MSDKKKTFQGYRLVLQDTGDPLTRSFGPAAKTCGGMTREQLVKDSLEPIKGLPFDGYAHCVNHAKGVYHKSDVRERVMDDVKRFRGASSLQMKDAYETLDAQGVDVLETYCEEAHEQGQSCMLRLRMQDVHDRMGYYTKIDSEFSSSPKFNVAEPYYYIPTWKKQHPQYLLGDATDGTDPEHPDFFSRTATNYALQPVIDYHFAMAKELIDRYSMDTLELDFMRFLFYFHPHEAYVQRHVMTALVRQIKKHVDKVNADRVRPLALSVRVPDTPELCLRHGIDIRVWLTEGLVDGITISGGYSPFGTPWRELVELADQAGVPALACLSAGPLGRDIEVIRAAAARAISHGCHGVMLWNYFYCMDHYHKPGENPLPLAEFGVLADHAELMRTSKRYELSKGLEMPMIRHAHMHGAWLSQLPMSIGVGAEGYEHIVEFEVADDPSLHNDGYWTIKASFLDIAPDDELTFKWNGRPIELSKQSWWADSAHDRHYLEFKVLASDCVKGVNQWGIALRNRHPQLDPNLTLTQASLSVPSL